MTHRFLLGLISGLLALASPSASARDLTFFHVSDTHYGRSSTGDQGLAALVDLMNRLPGTPYPTNLGGTVSPPRGVIHTGDVTESGKPEQWAAFVRDFGLDGTDGRLRFPVFETFGNHDGGPKSPVRQGIRERNGRRAGLDEVASNRLHYAWTWDGIRFLHCGISIGTRLKTYDPEDSLDFLRSQLAREAAPMIILHHFGFDKGHSLGWWKDDSLEVYRQAQARHPVLAILHGHAHDPFIDRWADRAVYHPPHFRQRPQKTGPLQHGVFVFRITDAELTVAERRLDGTWGLTARQPLAHPEVPAP